MAEGHNPKSEGTRTVAIVPHTHWDREWYLPFQSFRARLVAMLDELLPRLEGDLSYTHFTLDGQMAVIDDYLAVRPEAEPRLRALAASGRLSVGPWYVLPDEFLVSGETLVRNLQYGVERAAAFGGHLRVGYLPDMFGHVAQMPQLLSHAGFGHAVVWRGVPAAVDRNAFWWTAPDGCTVRAEYLPVGYGNGAAVPDDAKRLVERIRAHETELGTLVAPGEPMLWMNGSDHQSPQTWLGRVVAEANELQDEYRLVITSLPEYLDSAPVDRLPHWTGELRSGARANLLMGVASNRVDVKQAAARAERALERLAEPLCALFLAPSDWPGSLLRVAWTEMLRNAAHDSVCACSADDVVDAVLHRYNEARHVAEALTAQALTALGQSISASGPVIVNPSPRARSGLVELLLAGDDAPHGAQVLDRRPGRVTERVLDGAGVGAAIGHVRNYEQAVGCDVRSVDVVDSGDHLEVVMRTGPAGAGGGGGAAGPGAGDPPVAAALSELYARAGAHRHDPVAMRIEYGAFQRVLVRAEEVPAYGWRRWQPPTPAPAPARATPPAVSASERSLDNGLVRVEVDPTEGTFSINGLEGLDLLVEDGDAGDTYNYSPPEFDVVVDAPTSVSIDTEEAGPLRAALRVTRAFEWPERIDGGARVGHRRVEVSTRLELRAGEGAVRITTRIDNQCRDHRVRTWFPLPHQTQSSQAECAFAVVRRGMEAEGGPNEKGLPTFPSRRFVSAGGLTLFHEGLLEYELVDGGRALALTLLRCVGVLSGTEMAYRPMPAGPPLAVEGAQMAGPIVLRYAVAVGDVDPFAVVDDVFLPLLVASGSGHGGRPAEGSAFSVSGAQVSALRRAGDAIELRVFNPTDEEATVHLGTSGGHLVDLLGRPVEPFHGAFRLRPWGIATARLTPP